MLDLECIVLMLRFLNNSFKNDFSRGWFLAYGSHLRVSTAVINTMTRSNLGRRGFMSAHSSQPILPLRKLRAELKERAEQKPWRNGSMGKRAHWLAQLSLCLRKGFSV